MNSYSKRMAVAAFAALCIPSTAFAATTYTVQSGDSLWAIANKYHTTVHGIEQANGMHSSFLKLGERLTIPTSTKGTAETKRTTSYHPIVITVHSGNTLWGISQDYHISIKQLMSWNHLSKTSLLHIGEHLIVGTHSVGLSGRSESSAGALSGYMQGMTIADFSKRFIGVPYRWGGESTRGFDCSGLVQLTYAHFGIHLPRTSYAMYHKGSYVSKGNLMPGDLVFFSSDGAGASHVGIYVGGGKFISAEDIGVHIASMNSSYWSRYYYGARRVTH